MIGDVIVFVNGVSLLALDQLDVLYSMIAHSEGDVQVIVAKAADMVSPLCVIRYYRVSADPPPLSLSLS